MIQDLSPDVKKFLLSYDLIHQVTGLAKYELNKVYGRLEDEITSQNWFSSVDFQTQISFKWLQVWKKNWHPNVNQRCPWIHFEYGLLWLDQCVQASLDFETLKIVSWEAVKDVAKCLHDLMSSEKPSLLEGQGWMLKFPLEGNRMLLTKRHYINESEFSAEWIFNTGKELFSKLSEIIPLVDHTVKQLPVSEA